MTTQVLTTWLAGPAGDGLLAWLGSWTARGGLVLVAAALAAWCLRRRSAALRHATWCAGLAAFLLVPVIAGAIPDWRLAVLPRQAVPPPGAIARDAGERPAALSPTESPPRGGTTARRVPVPATTPDARGDAGALVLLAWLAGAAFAVARLAVSHVRLGAVVRGARPVTDHAWLASLEEASVAVGIGRRVTLAWSDAIRVPMACGLLAPRVLLPSFDRCPDAESRRAVLVHELGHVRRGDVWWQFTGGVVRAGFWFHPLVWLATHRLRAESELACDDGVLLSGERPSRYAETLLAFATPVPVPAAALAFVGPGGIEHRVASVLAARRDRLPLSRVARLAVSAGAAALALGLALPVLVPAHAGPEGAGERRAARVRNESGAPVELRGATVRVRPTVTRWTDAAPLGPEVRLDAPLLELANHGTLAVAAVLVRLETRHLSRDLMWEDVRIRAGGAARLMLPPELWSHQAPRAHAERFTISIAAVRFADRTEWWGATSERPSPDPADAPTPVALPAKAKPRVTPAPDAPAPHGSAPRPARPAASHPVQVIGTPGAPVAIEDAFTPDPGGESEDGQATTTLPDLTLRNVGTRRIVAVKLRFKADAESHAVTIVRSPIDPGAAIRYHRDLVVRGRPERMTAQVLGVRYEGGDTWGSLDSRIDARDAVVRVGDR